MVISPRPGVCRSASSSMRDVMRLIVFRAAIAHAPGGFQLVKALPERCNVAPMPKQVRGRVFACSAPIHSVLPLSQDTADRNHTRLWTECSTPSTSMSGVFLPCGACQKPGFQRSEEPEPGPVDTAGRRDFRRLIMKSSTHHSNAPRSTSEAGSQ